MLTIDAPGGGRVGQQRGAYAIDYMTTAEDLARAVTTAFVHCRPGGVALFAPGLFPRSLWLDTLAAAGFEPERVPFEHSELDPGPYEGFLGRMPERG